MSVQLQQIVEQISRFYCPSEIVDNLFHQRFANSLSSATVDLPVDDHWIYIGRSHERLCTFDL